MDTQIYFDTSVGTPLSCLGSHLEAVACVLGHPAHVYLLLLLLTSLVYRHVCVQVSWLTLNLPAINAELQTAVCSTDLELNALEDKGQLTTETAMSALKPFALDFGLLPVDGEPRTFHVCLTNPGALPAHWELHSYDDPEVCE